MSGSFQPGDPDFRNRVAASFARQRAMETVGISLARIDAGEVEMTMPFNLDFTQQHGFVHAGIVCTALDTTCGYAAFTLMPAEAETLTIEFKTNFLAPAVGERFRFVGRVVKPGRTVSVVEGQAFAETAGAEKLIATMSCTMIALFGREGVNR